MSQDKSPENFDDIDELATSLQDKIKQLNGASLSSDANEYVVDHSIGNDNFKTDIDDVSIREQLTEGFKEQADSEKPSKVKTSILIGVLSVALIAIAVLSATLFFPSAEEEIARLKELPLTLPKPVKEQSPQHFPQFIPNNSADISGKAATSGKKTDHIIQEKDLLTDESLANKVKKIPLVLIDEPDLATIDKTNPVKELEAKELTNVVTNKQENIQNSISKEVTMADSNINDIVEGNNSQKETQAAGSSSIVSETTELEKVQTEPLDLDFKHEKFEKKQETTDEISSSIKENIVVDTKLEDLKEKANDVLLTVPVKSEQAIKETLINVTPDILIAQNKRQSLSLVGNNFNDATKVVVKWLDNDIEKSKEFSSTLTPKQFKKINNEKIELSLNTGNTAGQWSISLPSGKGTKSIILNVYLPYNNKKSIQSKKELKEKILSENKKNLKNTPQFVKPETKQKYDSQNSENSILTKPNNYTIQLLSASNLNSINKLLAKYAQVQPLTWVKTNAKGKTWYRLIYGSFKTKKQAKAAYLNLPKKLQTKGYWVRQVKELLHEPRVGKLSQLTAQTKNFKQVTGSQLLKLLSIPPTNWTLELLTFNSKIKMDAYVKANKLGTKANYYKKVVNGKVRYTLIYGIFTSKRAVTKALQNLPNKIKISKPWLKKYSDIQWEIKNSRYYQ